MFFNKMKILKFCAPQFFEQKLASPEFRIFTILRSSVFETKTCDSRIFTNYKIFAPQFSKRKLAILEFVIFYWFRKSTVFHEF